MKSSKATIQSQVIEQNVLSCLANQISFNNRLSPDKHTCIQSCTSTRVAGRKIEFAHKQKQGMQNLEAMACEMSVF